MIFAWLTAKAFLGLSKGVWLLAAVALLTGGVIWLRAAENADDKHNQQVGATVQREKNVTATIQQVERANEASETLRRDTGAAFDECVRNARNPSDC